MRGRLFAVPLLLGGALVAPLTISPVAHGAAPPYTVTALRIKVQVPDCPGTPATPVNIAADLYTPAGASKTHRVPAILTTNGFGGSKSDQAGLGKAFASNGYAVLSYSGLGFGGSSCRISLDDRKHDGAAAAQLVDYLGGKTGLGFTDASPDPHGPARFGTPVDIDFVQHDATGKLLDPRVGMVGGSYGGQIQYAATAASGGRIDTIVPVITWNDLAYSLAPNNTSFRRGVSYATPGVHKKDWTSLFFADGIASGLQYVTEDPPSRTVSTAPPTPPSLPQFPACINFLPQACTAKAHLDTLGYPDPAALALTRQASVASYLGQIRIPTLLMQGQADSLFNLQESVATYRALRAQNTPVGLVWQSWGHSNSTPAPGEYDSNSPLGTYQGDLVKAWFDHYLKGVGPTPNVGFQYFRDYAYAGGTDRQKANNAYARTATYPAATSLTKYYLSGNNPSDPAVTLTPDRSRVVAGNSTFVTPPPAGPAGPYSYSETSAVQGQLPQPLQKPSDPAGTFAAYTAAPFVHDTDVVGIPTLDVRINSTLTSALDPALELVLFAKIYDLDPQGQPTLVHQLISPVRISSSGARVHIELPGIVHQFPAGHRLQLVIAGSDSAYGALVNGGNDSAHTVSVITAPTNPAVLKVPALP